MPSHPSLADLLGPWHEPAWESGLVARCRAAWDKPLPDLTNAELATLLRQRIATAHLLPLARARLAAGTDDDTECYEGELAEVVRQD